MRRAASKRSEVRIPRATAPVIAARASASCCWNGPLDPRRATWTAPHTRPRMTNAARSSCGMSERQKEIAVARAALGIAAGGVLEDPDRHPLGGEPGERVDVVD